MAVAGMLMEGWTREQLRQVIAGRPLPDNIHKTVGAVIARRLRDALTGPPPYVGQQFKEDPLPKDKPTPTPNAWTGVAIATDHRKARCPECHRPLRDSTEDVLCSDCREELASV